MNLNTLNFKHFFIVAIGTLYVTFSCLCIYIFTSTFLLFLNNENIKNMPQVFIALVAFFCVNDNVIKNNFLSRHDDLHLEYQHSEN